jgi:hypothetical protein
MPKIKRFSPVFFASGDAYARTTVSKSAKSPEPLTDFGCVRTLFIPIVEGNRDLLGCDYEPAIAFAGIALLMV